MKHLFNSLLAISFLLALNACSKEDSDKVEISFSPENPRVNFYDQPLTVYVNPADGTPQIETIKQPWFRFKMNVTNGASKNVVISNLNLTIKGVSATQGFSTTAVTISPSDLFVNKNNIDTDDQTVMEEVPASNTEQIPIENSSNQPELSYIYVGGLPKEVTTGVFNVEVEAVGWFGTTTNPTAVFQQKYYFTTD